MTLDSILLEIQDLVEKGIDLSVAQWIDLAAKINILLMSLETDLIKAEMAVNREKALMGDTTDANATPLVKAMPVYETYLLLKAKRDRAEETIRLAKQRTRIEPWQK